MYRILVARSGYYFVQRRDAWGNWSKTGGFFRTRTGARNFINDLRYGRCCSGPRVVKYY